MDNPNDVLLKIQQMVASNQKHTQEIRIQTESINERNRSLRKRVEDLRKRTAALKEASRLSKGDKEFVLKTCGCGREYHVEDWFDLPFTGYQESQFMDGEMRQCACQSTMLFVTERKVVHHG